MLTENVLSEEIQTFQPNNVHLSLPYTLTDELKHSLVLGLNLFEKTCCGKLGYMTVQSKFISDCICCCFKKIIALT